MECKLNRFTVVMLVEVLKQVSVGVLSAGNPSLLSSTKRPSYVGRITRVSGRDVRAFTEGNHEAKPRSRASSIAMPRRGYSAPSSGGARGGPRSGLR
jgi:hypothetical protein